MERKRQGYKEKGNGKETERGDLEIHGMRRKGRARENEQNGKGKEMNRKRNRKENVNNKR